jgi:hypothetical protein
MKISELKKFKVTIKQVIEEEFEMILENVSILQAFDEARRLADSRNKTIRRGKFYVTKIDIEE